MGGRCPICNRPDRGEAECPNCGFPLSQWRHRDPGRLSEEERARYEAALSLARQRYIQNRLSQVEQRIHRMASPERRQAAPLVSPWTWLYVLGYGLLFALVSGGFRYILGEAIPPLRTWFSPEIFDTIDRIDSEYGGPKACLIAIMGLIFMGWILLIFHDYEASG